MKSPQGFGNAGSADGGVVGVRPGLNHRQRGLAVVRNPG